MDSLRGIDSSRPSCINDAQGHICSPRRDSSISLDDHAAGVEEHYRQATSTRAQYQQTDSHDSCKSPLYLMTPHELLVTSDFREGNSEDGCPLIDAEPSPISPTGSSASPLEAYLEESSRHEQRAMGIHAWAQPDILARETASRFKCLPALSTPPAQISHRAPSTTRSWEMVEVGAGMSLCSTGSLTGDPNAFEPADIVGNESQKSRVTPMPEAMECVLPAWTLSQTPMPNYGAAMPLPQLIHPEQHDVTTEEPHPIHNIRPPYHRRTREMASVRHPQRQRGVTRLRMRKKSRTTSGKGKEVVSNGMNT